MWCVTASPSGTSSCPQVQGQPSWSCLRCVCERLTHNQGIQNPTTAALQQRIRESQSAWVGRDPKIIQHPHSAPSSAASHSSQPPSFVLPHLPGTFLAEKLNSGWKRHFNSLPFTPGSCCSSPCISLSAHSWGNFSLPWTVLTAALAFSNPNQVLGFFLGILLLIFPVSVSLRTFSSAYSHPATLKPFCLFIFPYKHSHLWLYWGWKCSSTSRERLQSSSHLTEKFMNRYFQLHCCPGSVKQSLCSNLSVGSSKHGSCWIGCGSVCSSLWWEAPEHMDNCGRSPFLPLRTGNFIRIRITVADWIIPCPA